MRAVLLGLAAPVAAIAIPAAPADAQAAAGQPMAAAPGQFDQFAALPRVHRNIGAHRPDGRRHDRRKHRRFGGTVVIGDFQSDAWALYNNRSWEPDSFNDWWHDRPDRAYPRWMQNNQNCDRLWWGGGVWRCTW